MGISERINKLLERRGITRYKLAKMSKVPYTTLIKVLDGTTRNPQIETLTAIADVLGVSLDKLTNDSVSDIIEERLKFSEITIEELAKRANVKVEYLKNIDDIIPDPGDYEAIDRIAKEIFINPQVLRHALARQEPSSPEGPQSSIEKDFESVDFDEETRMIAREIQKLKPENRALLKSILDKLD